ncbi:MAG: hypothetical protein RLZZ77_108 [Bacteroidota bacterium]|jgi:hypothetical protein
MFNWKDHLHTSMKKVEVELLAKRVLDDHSLLESLILACENKDSVLSRKGAWVLGVVSQKNKNLISPYSERLVHLLGNTHDSSVHREVFKVLAAQKLPDDLFAQVLDFSFNSLNNPLSDTAVKYNSFLFIIKSLPKYPELKNELLAITERQIPHVTAPLAYQMKKHLAKLK